jgi:hypothetical protein
MKLHSILIAFVLAFLPAALNAAAISDTATNTIVTGTATDRVPFTANSAGVYETFVLTAVPGAPTSPVATRGNASASVTFTAPASNGGSAILSYTVTSSPGGVTGTGSASPISVGGLTNGTAYTFTVTATNAVGPSAASAPSAAVTPATVPDVPTSPVATAGNASASVAFTAPTSNGGSAITGYTVTSSPGGFTNSGAGTPIVVSGLTNGTAYTFTVTATNVIGNSAPSAASAAVTPMAPAAVPTLTSVSPATGSTAGLTTVTLTGTNFTGATGVTFGGIAATGLSVTNATTLTCVTPARAAGAASVVVTTPGGVNVANTLYSYVDVLSSISGGILTLNASAASDLTFSLVGSNMVVTSTNGGVVGPGGATSISFPHASFPNGLVINGSSGIDTFTFDYTNGEPFPGGTVEVNGGDPSSGIGDSLLVVGGNFGSIAYNPGASGGGDIDLDGRTVSFTGLEPVDFSGTTIGNLTVNVDPQSTYVGNVITTIATADAGVNTNITFGSSGLESVKVGAITGTLTVNGDNVENDYFQLDGLGSAMVGHFVVDGLGGDADVVEIDNTTVTVAGLNKNFTARADFIGIGALSALPTSPGVLVCSGNITLESNGPSGLLIGDLIFGPDGTPGVWGLRSAKPEFGTAPFMRPGDIIMRGRIEKPSGSPATLHLKAKDAVFMEGPTAPISSVLYGPSVIATAGVLNVLIQTDSDTMNNGHCTMRNATVTTNGGTLTIGGGADPLNTPTNASSGNGFGGVNLFATAITTNGGDVSMRGRGNINIGVSLTSVANATNGACFIDAGSGDILVHGQVMTQVVGLLNGVRLFGQSNGPTLLPASLTTSGDITVTGINNVVGGNGVFLNRASAITSTGTGNVTVTGSGIGAPTASNGLGILLIPVANTTTQISSAGGNVTLIADKMNLNATAADTTEVVSTTGSGIVTLKPLTAAVAINLGSTVDTTASTLELSTAELDNVTAGTLAIGDAASGAINVSAVIAPLNFKTLALGNNTTFNAGFTADVTSASVYEKMTVTGTATITAGTLTLNSAGGYIWNGTDTFTIVANDAADTITGTFTGPTLTSFLGSALTAQQSYTAGTGNDLLIGNLNQLPTFSGYTLSVTKNTTAVLGKAKLLARCADADGGTPAITAVLAASAQGGTVSLGATSISYAPPTGFTGLDTFQFTLSDGQGGSISATVTVNVTSGSGESQNRAKLTVLPGGNVALLFQGVPGVSYQIQRSTDLLTWTTLQTSNAAVDGTLPFTDTSPPGGSAFYRTALAP